jgi:hypothetical protein
MFRLKMPKLLVVAAFATAALAVTPLASAYPPGPTVAAFPPGPYVAYPPGPNVAYPPGPNVAFPPGPTVADVPPGPGSDSIIAIL